jgi:hypothetical protein
MRDPMKLARLLCFTFIVFVATCAYGGIDDNHQDAVKVCLQSSKARDAKSCAVLGDIP